MAQNEHDRLVARIQEMDQKLDDTKEALRWNTGPVNDAMKLVVPMMKDQLVLMKEIVDYAGRATF